MKLLGMKAIAMYAFISILGFITIMSISLGWFNNVFAQTPKIGASSPPVVLSDAARVLNDAMVSVSDAIKPTVVTITVDVKTSHSQRFGNMPEFHDFFRFFGIPEEEQRSRGAGSGVFISENGYIVTNHHVIDNAIEDGIKVITVDRKEHKAKLIGSDPLTDLAVIKIEGNGYPVAHFANIDDVKIGQYVIAVGNPLGLNFTVTSGIISSLGRGQLGLPRRTPYSVEHFIQTDAAINPGNSGGGLFNLEGSLVGINTAIASQNGTFIGYGFAIPIDLVRSVIEDLIEDGKINRGYIGVQITSLDETVARSVGLDEVEGALVNDVIAKSPAEKAGIEPGDVILELDGRKVSTSGELTAIIAQKRAGDKVNLTIWRNKKKMNKTVTLESRDGDDVATATKGERSHKEDSPKNEPITFDKLGFSVTPLTAELRKEYDVTSGVFITSVSRFTHAAERGLMPNGVITRVDRSELKTTDQLKKIIDGKKPGETILFQVKYKERNAIVALEILK